MPLPFAHERSFEELVEPPRGGIVAALGERRSYPGEGIEGRLDACVRFGEDLEQRELHRADGDHPRSMRPPRDRSVTGFRDHISTLPKTKLRRAARFLSSAARRASHRAPRDTGCPSAPWRGATLFRRLISGKGVRGTESLQTPRWRGESGANQSLKWGFQRRGI